MLIIYPSIAYVLSFTAMVMIGRQQNLGLTDIQASNQNSQNTWFHVLLPILLVLHGFACYIDIFTPSGLVFGFAQALSLMAWVGVALFWVEGWFFNLKGMMPLVLVIATMCSFLPVVFNGAIISTRTVDSPWFKLHFITANIAYGVMFLAAIQALLMIWQEKKLRTHTSENSFSWLENSILGKPARVLDQLPPLITMERVLFNVIGIGFCLLSVAVFSGVFFSEILFGKPLTFDHKTVFALLSWVMFGSLLFAHWRFGMRGGQALKWVLGSFTVLLLAYVGSRFVLEVILGRL